MTWRPEMGDSQGRVKWLVSGEGSWQEVSGKVSGWLKGQDATMGMTLGGVGLGGSLGCQQLTPPVPEIRGGSLRR